jgi:hypothetical protein
MSDPTAILITNLQGALQQLNTYVAVGLTTAVSAFVLDRRPPGPAGSDPVPIPGGFVPMAPETAKLVLIGVCFVVGLMAAYAAESADSIARMLQTNLELFKAACTYPSVATAPKGIRLLAAALPVAFVVPIMWRTWSRIRALSPGEDWGGLIALIGVIVVPYGALGLALMRLSCGA